jgi:hypothetical protein
MKDTEHEKTLKWCLIVFGMWRGCARRLALRAREGLVTLPKRNDPSVLQFVQGRGGDDAEQEQTPMLVSVCVSGGVRDTSKTPPSCVACKGGVGDTSKEGMTPPSCVSCKGGGGDVLIFVAFAWPRRDERAMPSSR